MGYFPMLLLEPTGGICNRLRAIVSAQRLARDRGSSLVILWKRDHHLSARYGELFIKPVDILKVLPIARETTYRAVNAVICRVFRDRLEQADIEAMNRENVDYTRHAAGRSIFIRTHSRFHCECDFSLVKPLPEIVRTVAGYELDRLGAVGVHIRRTDNQRSIEHSPTELFVEAMRMELAENPGAIFFVATDSPQDEQRLRRVFPGRIISHPKVSLNRRDPRAIRDALIDLYCLASCRKLLGSYWSSFSETAAAIGKMPLQIVKGPGPG